VSFASDATSWSTGATNRFRIDASKWVPAERRSGLEVRITGSADAVTQRQLREGRLFPDNRGHEPLPHNTSKGVLLPGMMPVGGAERKSGGEATEWGKHATGCGTA